MNLLATTAAAYWSNKLILRARNKGNRNITVILYYSANYKHHSTVNHHSTDTIPMENVDRVEDLINIQACNFWQKGKDSTGVLGDNMSCVFFYSCRASIIFQWVRQPDSHLKLYPIKQWLSGWTVDSLDDSGKFLHIKPKAWQSSDQILMTDCSTVNIPILRKRIGTNPLWSDSSCISSFSSSCSSGKHDNYSPV